MARGAGKRAAVSERIAAESAPGVAFVMAARVGDPAAESTTASRDTFNRALHGRGLTRFHGDGNG